MNMDYSILKRLTHGIDEILFDYESYETIPIINRYRQISCLKKKLSSDEISVYLMNLAILYLNEARLFASASSAIHQDNLFLGILQEEEIYHESGVYIPHIVVTPHKDRLKFYNNNNRFPLEKSAPGVLFSGIVGISCFDLFVTEEKELGRSYYFVPQE